MSADSLLFEVTSDGSNSEQKVYIGTKIINDGFVALSQANAGAMEVSLSTASGHRFTAIVKPPRVLLTNVGSETSAACVYVMEIDKGGMWLAGLNANISMPGWTFAFHCPISEKVASSAQHLELPANVALKRVYANFSAENWQFLDPALTAPVVRGEKITWAEWQRRNPDAVEGVFECLKQWGNKYAGEDISTLAFYVQPSPKPDKGTPMSCGKILVLLPSATHAEAIAYKGAISKPAGLVRVPDDPNSVFFVDPRLFFEYFLSPLLRPLCYASDAVHYQWDFDSADWGQYKWTVGVGGNPGLSNADTRYGGMTKSEDDFIKVSFLTWSPTIPATQLEPRRDGLDRGGFFGEFKMAMKTPTGVELSNFSKVNVQWDKSGYNTFSINVTTELAWQQQADWKTRTELMREEGGEWKSAEVREDEKLVVTHNTAEVDARIGVQLGSIKEGKGGALPISFIIRGIDSDTRPSRIWTGAAPIPALAAPIVEAIDYVAKQLSEGATKESTFQPATQFVFPLQGYLTSTGEQHYDPAVGLDFSLSTGLICAPLRSGERRGVPQFLRYAVPIPANLPPKKVEYLASITKDPRQLQPGEYYRNEDDYWWHLTHGSALD